MAARIIVIFIAIWSVIQGFVYGILSILALLAHDCQISMRQSKLTYLMYIIFFRDQKCEPFTYWNIVADIPPPNEPIWPAVTLVAYRTNILALIYLLLSTIWIITSLMLIVGCFTPCFGKVTYYLLMMPWAVFCTLTSILDVVAVGFFFYDLFNTLNMESFVRHMEMRNTSSIFASLEINASLLPMPAVILLIVASRGFLFWCLNILSIPIVLTNGKTIIYGGKGMQETSDDRDFRYARNHPRGNNNNNILESHFPATTERSRYSDPSHYHQYQYDNMSYQQDKYDLSRSIGRRYVEPLKGETIDEPDSNVKRIVVSRNSSHDDNKSSKKSSWSDDSNNSASTVHLSYAHNNPVTSHSHNINSNQTVTSWRHMPTDAVLKIERPRFILPNKPSLLKKLSDSSHIPLEEPHPSVQYTGDELRSQLPWSYFDARSDIIKPKKSFNDLRDDEVAPPVPVPDYTMYLPRKNQSVGERKSMPAKKFINPKRGPSNEQESRWSGPEYRY